MGFRARKSFKIAPGVRMTVSPRGVGYSAGVKGARISKGADGRVRSSVGIPGSGVSYVQTHGGGRSRPASRPAAPSPAAAAPPTPGLLAPKWEKALHKAAVVGGIDAEALRAVATSHVEARPVSATLEAIVALIPNREYERARQSLAWVMHESFDPTVDPFLTKYMPGLIVSIGIADGITVEVPLDQDALGLMLAELHQQAGDLPAAVAVVEQLTPTTVTAVSLVELYAEQARWGDVVDLTEGLLNEDEPSTYLIMQRGVALREMQMYGAAREAFKEALRIRSRPAALRHQALVERAATYNAEGKPAMARKDLEKVFAENSRHPGVREALEGL